MTRCLNCTKTENSTKVGGWTCNLCTDRIEYSNRASISQLSDSHDTTKEKYENLKDSARNSEEEARQRLLAAEKKIETHLQELHDLKCRIGTILESENFADLSIEVEGRTVKAHKCILASRYV